MDLRRPLLLVALTMIVLGVLVELASPLVSGRAGLAADTLRTTALADLPGAGSGSVRAAQEPPGGGITAMALLDGALTFRIALMALALVVPVGFAGTAAALTAPFADGRHQAGVGPADEDIVVDLQRSGPGDEVRAVAVAVAVAARGDLVVPLVPMGRPVPREARRDGDPRDGLASRSPRPFSGQPARLVWLSGSPAAT